MSENVAHISHLCDLMGLKSKIHAEESRDRPVGSKAELEQIDSFIKEMKMKTSFKYFFTKMLQ